MLTLTLYCVRHPARSTNRCIIPDFDQRAKSYRVQPSPPYHDFSDQPSPLHVDSEARLTSEALVKNCIQSRVDPNFPWRTMTLMQPRIDGSARVPGYSPLPSSHRLDTGVMAFRDRGVPS